MREFLHTNIWQRLPRDLRRQLLFTGTSLIAPRPSPAALPREPVIVVGALRTASGLGQSARLSYAALRRSRLRVYAIDVSSVLNQPLDAPQFAYEDGQGLMGPGTLLLHVNAPFVPLVLLRLGKVLVEHKHVIGYWHWELSEVPPEWNRGASFVHRALAPSAFTAQAIQKTLPKLRVTILPHPVAVGAQSSSPPPHPHADRLNVCTIFNAASGFTRKNPLAAVEAFRRAFGSDRKFRLLVKASHLDAFPSGSAELRRTLDSMNNAQLIEQSLSSEQLHELYSTSFAVLSLHRSEGFGLVLSEGMLNGCVPVATNWSGTTDFVTTDRGLPVSYRLVPANDPQQLYDFPELEWADADIDDAAAKLRTLLDRDNRRQLALESHRFAWEHFSAAAYVQKFQTTLQLGLD